MTDSNFRGKVLDGGEPWLVEFYAPWCGHCQRLEPEWKSAASEVHEKTGNKVKMGMLDATQHQNTASQYGIQGTLFPYLGCQKNPMGILVWLLNGTLT